MRRLEYIVVNAISLRIGGGLVVLRQFIDDIMIENRDANKVFCFYVPEDSDFEDTDNLKFVKVKKKGKLGLLLWHAFGFYWRVRSDYDISLVAQVISLQNFDVFFPNRKRVVYFQQALMLDHKKQYLKIKSRILFSLYRVLYAITLLTADVIIVQNQWVKDLHKVRFRKHSHKIKVVNPYSLISLDVKSNCNGDVLSKVANIDNMFLYPAHFYPHKNHQVIVNAVQYLVDSGRMDDCDFRIVFTIDESEFDLLDVPAGLRRFFICLGSLAREDVLTLLGMAVALIFPSKCETIGLPLLEAVVVGCCILVADQPYAAPLTLNYTNCKFIDPDDVVGWANGILFALRSGKKTPLQSFERSPSLYDLVVLG